MDIGAIIQAPMKDKDWIKKCAMVGLFGLVPIAGGLNAIGWMKEVYKRVKAGDTTLPEANFSYLGSGWALFLAVVPIIVVPIFFGVIQGVLMATRNTSLVPIVSLINLPVSLFMNLVFVPTLIYRHVTVGTGFSGVFDFGGIKEVWTKNMGNFATFAVLYFLGSLIGGLGFIACCVGGLVTFPMGMAIHANAIKAFEDASKA